MKEIWVDSDIALIECSCGNEITVVADADEDYRNQCERCGKRYVMHPAFVEEERSEEARA